jgi:hypothetical protein
LINILLITSDQRALAIGDRLQSQPMIKVDTASDFDNGLKDVFDKRPQLVFIQGDIDGVTGETVARHIKGLLRDQSPRLILLRETLQTRQGAKSCYDGNIDLFLAADDLLTAFREQLEKVAGFKWQDEVPDEEQKLSVLSTADQYAAALAAASAEAAEPFSEYLPSEALSEKGDLASLPGKPAVTAHPPSLISPLQPTKTPDHFLPLEESEQMPNSSSKATPPPFDVEMKAPSPTHTAVGLRDTPRPQFTPPPFEYRLPGRATHHRPWLYIVVFLVTLALGAGTYLYVSYSKPRFGAAKAVGTAKTASKPASDSSLPVTLTKIPSFIPQDRIDGTYASAHPGWDRYTDDAREYLVFSEKGAIKAVQIIALRQGALSDAFVRSSLQEISGSGTYQVGYRSEKDGYLVEKGLAKGNIELAIYHKGASGEIRALVVALP